MTGQPKMINWKGYTKKNRTQAIDELKNIIGRYGYILESNLFSDMALSMIIGIEERKINGLYTALNAYMTMGEYKPVTTASDCEYILSLNVTFNDSTGNLEHEIPSFPG